MAIQVHSAVEPTKTTASDLNPKVGARVKCIIPQRAGKAYAKFGAPAKVGDTGTVTKVTDLRDVTIVQYTTADGRDVYAHIQNLSLKVKSATTLATFETASLQGDVRDLFKPNQDKLRKVSDDLDSVVAAFKTPLVHQLITRSATSPSSYNELLKCAKEAVNAVAEFSDAVEDLHIDLKEASPTNASVRAETVTAAKTLIQQLVKSMEAKGAWKVKRFTSDGDDTGIVYLSAPLKLGALDKVTHKGSRYYPDGPSGNYLNLIKPKDGATAVSVDAH